MSTEASEKKSPYSVVALVTAAVFGAVALAIVLAKLTIPIPGTGVVTDPRELFTTLGAGLSGPIGALIVGFLAGIAEPGGINLASLLGHIAGALWMGFAYKKLVHERLEMPALLLGWAGLVVAYYFVFVLPGFTIGIALFHPDIYAEFFGDVSIAQAYLALGQGALPEAVLTTLITTLAMAAIPVKYRRPLW